jgi:hypothetical protein
MRQGPGVATVNVASNGGEGPTAKLLGARQLSVRLVMFLTYPN